MEKLTPESKVFLGTVAGLAIINGALGPLLLAVAAGFGGRHILKKMLDSKTDKIFEHHRVELEGQLRELPQDTQGQQRREVIARINEAETRRQADKTGNNNVANIFGIATFDTPIILAATLVGKAIMNSEESK